MYIVATISKNSYSAVKIEEILLAGATVLRFNFSHGTPEEMSAKIGVAREIIAKHGMQDTVKILADLPGAKIRLGDLQEKERPVVQGEEVVFCSLPALQERRDVPVDFPDIGKYVRSGQTVTLADGEIAFTVIKVFSPYRFLARALIDGHIPALKGINIGGAIDALDHFTPKTLEHIRNLQTIRPDWIAFSFVNSEEALRRGRDLLHTYGADFWNPRIVAKIESPLGVKNIDEISRNTDILMVARGDLGLTTPIAEVGIAQKRIVAAAKKYRKEVIVATQILDSLLTYYVPERAEVLDVTNCVLDGVDGIMLTKETGISLTPGYSVAVAKQIIEAAEAYQRLP